MFALGPPAKLIAATVTVVIVAFPGAGTSSGGDTRQSVITTIRGLGG